MLRGYPLIGYNFFKVLNNNEEIFVTKVLISIENLSKTV